MGIHWIALLRTLCYFLSLNLIAVLICVNVLDEKSSSCISLSFMIFEKMKPDYELTRSLFYVMVKWRTVFHCYFCIKDLQVQEQYQYWASLLCIIILVYMNLLWVVYNMPV